MICIINEYIKGKINISYMCNIVNTYNIVNTHTTLKANIASTVNTMFYTFDFLYQVNINRYNPPMSTATTLNVPLLFKLHICRNMLETSKYNPGR